MGTTNPNESLLRAYGALVANPGLKLRISMACGRVEGVGRLIGNDTRFLHKDPRHRVVASSTAQKLIDFGLVELDRSGAGQSGRVQLWIPVIPYHAADLNEPAPC